MGLGNVGCCTWPALIAIGFNEAEARGPRKCYYLMRMGLLDKKLQ